ncbi:hypothetical protein PhCBS80983_g01508 [Powellomyces hirtus]|uniref:Uncharacterized protein n=1 Tax=Powellomyces hirtus TaxID=109895 RepID=A0A507EAF1_9FUNG|nr:hypothetical protein PhCBS80983_g01508 [Powellomyces hirtus]
MLAGNESGSGIAEKQLPSSNRHFLEAFDDNGHLQDGAHETGLVHIVSGDAQEAESGYDSRLSADVTGGDAAAAGNVVYKVDTLAWIGSEQNHRGVTACSAVQSQRGVCITVNEHAHLLDAACSKHNTTITLDCPAERTAFSQRAPFVVVADSLGTIHFVHVTTSEVVFSRQLVVGALADDGEPTFTWIGFTGKPTDMTEGLVVVLKNMTLFKFTNIDLIKLEQALEEGDLSMANELYQAIAIETVDLNQDSTDLKTVHDVVSVPDRKGQERIIVVGKGSQPLTVWQESRVTRQTIKVDAVERLLKGCTVIKAEVDAANKYLMLLEESGRLSVWDVDRLFMLHHYCDTKIVDFALSRSSSTSRSSFNIVALTDSGEIPETRMLQIIHLPDFTVTHHVRVASGSWLLKCQLSEPLPDSDHHGIRFIEELADEKSGKMKLYIRTLAQTVPLYRFEQLLHSKRFEEAEAFAQDYGLDVQFVVKAKLKQMASDIDLKEMVESGTTDQFVDQLVADLEDVEDDAFAIDFCLRTILPTFRATYRLLAFARSLAQDAAKNADSAATPAMILGVHQAIRRIGTYQLIAFERLNRRGGTIGDTQSSDFHDTDGFCAREWQELRTADIVVEIRELLRSGDLSLAIVIWKRHYLDEGLLAHIHEIVSDIPEHASLDEFVPWLRTEMLPIVQQSSDRTKLAFWIEHRARLVEAREKRPHGALEVVRLLDKVALPGMSDEQRNGPTTTARDQQLFTPATPAFYVENAVLFAQTSGISTFGFESSSGKVWANGLKKQLEDLVYLWDKHDFCATLNEYSQLTLSDIAKDLLDRVAAPELLQDAVEKHFRPYVERNGLVFEDLLAEYCVALMDGSLAAGGARALADSSWQARVLAILLCMTDVDIKVDVVMELMKRTPVPWGTDVGEVFLETLRYPAARRTEELREQYRLLKLKRMLVSYGISTFNISDKTLAKTLLPRILSRLDVVNAMKDAIQVVSAYHHLSKMEAYRIRLVNLFEAGLVERALNLLRTGCEESPSASQLADDDGLGLELDIRLELIQQIGIGKEVAVYLDLVMQDACHINETSPASLREEARNSYKWAIAAAVALSGVLADLRDDLGSMQTLENVPTGQAGSGALTSGQPVGITRALMTAAMEPELCGYENAAIIFSSLSALFTEFDVTMTMKDYASDVHRRKVLATFAKKVFKYVGNPDAGKAELASNARPKRGGAKGKGKAKVLDETTLADQTASANLETTQTALYRLAQVLGFERSRLRGILAEEAARNGDFRSALILCKELFDKFPDAQTAQTLQRVAHLLTEFAAENKQVYRDVKLFKSHSRLTSRIMMLAAQAFCVCDVEDVESALDGFKNYELQHTVFTQCDAGDYEALVARGKDEATSAFEYGASIAFDTVGGSVSAGSSSGAGASSSATSTEDSKLVEESTTKSSVSPEMELANIGDRFSASLFNDNFRESSLVLSTETAMDLASSFVLDASAAASSSTAPSYLLGLSHEPKSHKGKSQSERGHPTHSGRMLATYLVNNKSLQTVLRVLQRAKEAVLRSGGGGAKGEKEKWEPVVAFHFDTLGRLLASVMSSRTIDQKLAVGCLVAMPLKQAFEAYKAGMSTTGQEYSRVLRIAGIGIAVASAWKQRTFRISCEDLAANAKWWHQLRLLGIPFDKDMFKYRTETGGHQRRVVPELLHRTGFDILTALEFARSYDIEDDFVIIEYVKGLILTASDDSDYQSRVAGILEDVVNKERMLAALVNECLLRVSSYDYERIQFIATQILRLQPDSELAKTCREILNVLFDYVRTAAPGIEELLAAKHVMVGGIVVADPDTLQVLLQMFPKSHQRLPYHALKADPWTVLSAEMSEESIPRLRPLRKTLSLDLDKFYVVAVDNMFHSQMASIEELRGNAVPVGPTGQKLRFADVRKLVAHIADDLAAIETLLEVGKRFACGPDRINAYRMALARAERRAPKEQGEGGTTTNVDRIRQLLIVTETEHQLHSLDMQDMQQFISIDDHMHRLMHNLYWSKSELALDPKNDLDLHGVVNDIAKRNHVNAEEFRLWSLGKWLAAEVPISDEEREMYLPSMRVQINNVLNSREEVAIQMRLLYLLRSLPVAAGTHYLLNFVSQPTSKILTLNRVRALSVLFQLASPKELAKDGYDDIKNYMQMLLYLADFEELRIVQSLREFEKCDKEAFVRSLWVNHKDELKVVQLICNICLDYKVYDLTLWESALHRLLEKKVYRYLLGMLEHLTSVPELAQMRSLPRLWNGVLLGCLQLLAEHKETTLAMYDRVLTLVQKCPFLPELNVDAFVEHFDRMAMKTPATFDDLLSALRGIAALPPTAGMAETIKKSVSRLDSSELIQALDYMSDKVDSLNGLQAGGPGTAGFTAADTWIGKTWVIRAIYDQIDTTRSYELLLTTRHLRGFVSYLVECDRIEALIMASIRSQRTSAAADVLMLYYERHPNRLPPIPPPSPPSDAQDTDSDPDRNPEHPDLSEYTPVHLIEIYLATHSCSDDDELEPY